MERRRFIENLAKGAGTLIVLPVLVSACDTDPIDDPNGNTLSINLLETSNSPLTETGGSIIRSNIIIVNTGSNYIALSSVCTHNGCQVAYNHSEGNLPCPCHGSVFSTSGSVLNGPADSPLKQYSVTQDGDVLDIDLS